MKPVKVLRISIRSDCRCPLEMILPETIDVFFSILKHKNNDFGHTQSTVPYFAFTWQKTPKTKRSFSLFVTP